MTGKRASVRARGVRTGGKSEAYPEFCDFDCRHAAFAPPDAVGACRKEQGIYCLRFKTFNNKNSRCLGRR